MRAVIQRVSSASVKSDGGIIGQIGSGLLILVGIAKEDTAADCGWLAQKVVKLRIFPDPAGQMNLSVQDVCGEILVASQFTLFASTRKGTRPSFNDAAMPEIARGLYEEFILQLQTLLGHRVETGRFGAMMKISLVNDGPVTLIIDSKMRE